MVLTCGNAIRQQLKFNKNLFETVEIHRFIVGKCILKINSVAADSYKICEDCITKKYYFVIFHRPPDLSIQAKYALLNINDHISPMAGKLPN